MAVITLSSLQINDGGLTLNAATAINLLILISRADGTPLNLVIRDRASVIADYVETGSLSEKFEKIFPYSTNSESELPSVVSSIKFIANIY